MHIPGFRGARIGAVLKQSVTDFFADDMTTYAAALAYQVFFSLFPFIIFLVALLGFLDVPYFFDWLRQQAETLLPAQALEPVNQVITQIQQPQGGVLSFGILLALWSASGGVRATMNALNVAYDVEESRPAWKRYPLSLIYTILIAAMLILAAGLLIIGPEVMQWLAQQVGLQQIFVLVWSWIRWPLALLLLILSVAMTYYLAPDVEQDFRFITPGSTLAVLVWIAVSLAFGYYVRNFADYSATYGSIGAIIVLLLYFFITSAVLLFGAEVNAAIEHQAMEGKAPGQKRLNTTGAEQAAQT